MSWRAHGPLLTRIGEDVFARPAAVRDLINVGKRETGSCSGSARSPCFGVECGDGAISRYSRLDVRGRGRSVACRKMLFLAIEHHFDWQIRHLCELGANQTFAPDAQRFA